MAGPSTRGVPPFLIGDAEDTDFERHDIRHFVIGDAAPTWHRLGSRVYAIPGQPALHNILLELLRGLGLTVRGRRTQRAHSGRA